MEALKTVTYILQMHDMEKWSDGLHGSTENNHLHTESAQTRRKDQGNLNTENSHIQSEDAQTQRKNQVDITEALKTVTYMLRMHRQEEKIRWTSLKHWKQSLTCWGCTNKKKRSGELHRSTENSHLHAESAQTMRKNQGGLTEALKTVTYNLRMHRHREKIRWTSLKCWKQSLTCWGCTNTEKRSGELHRSTENSHIHPKGAQTRTQRSGGLHGSTENSHWHPEDAQTWRKDQVDFTEALKIVTYILRMHRHGEKIRWSKHWKQSLTHWGCTDTEKRSGGLHKSTENSHLHAEGAQTRRKGQMEFIEVQKHLHLCTAFTCALYYQPIVSIYRVLPHSLAICQQSRESTKGRK